MTGKRGPKSKPAALHLLNGNPSGLNKQKLMDEAEAISTELPEPPEFLGELARREWSRLGEILAHYGLVTQLDRAALAGYCVAYSRWAEAEAEIERLIQARGIGGALVQEYDSGARSPAPLLSIATKYHTQMTSLLKEFGLTPSARRGLELKRKEDGDPVADKKKGVGRFFD